MMSQLNVQNGTACIARILDVVFLLYLCLSRTGSRIDFLPVLFLGGAGSHPVTQEHPPLYGARVPVVEYTSF